MRNIRRAEIPLFLVLVLAFTLNNLVFVLDYSHSLSCYNLGIDTEHYYALAQQLADGAPVSQIPFDQPPGFIVLLSFLLRLFGGDNLLAPKIVFCVMTSCMAVMIWLLGRRLVGIPAGWIAGLAVVTSPMLRAYSATLQYEVPSAFLLVSSVGLLVLAAGISRFRHSLLLFACSGLLIATGALVREVIVVCFPVMLVWLLFSSGAERGQRIKFSMAFGIGFLVLVGSWTVYRSAMAGRFVAISSKGAFNFEIGNNPNANGTFNLNSTSITDPKGWNFIRQRPLDAAGLVARKFGFFWGFAEDGWNVPRRSSIWLFRLSFGLLPLPACIWLAQGSAVALLCFVGTVLLLGRRFDLWIFPAMIAAVMTVHLLLISSHRFAIPVLPLIYLMAGVCVLPIAHALKPVVTRAKFKLIAALLVWVSLAILHHPVAQIEWRLANYRTLRTKLVAHPKAPGQSTVLVPASAGPLRVAFIPDTILPKGWAEFAVDFESQPDGKGNTEVLEVRLYGEKQGESSLIRVARPGTGHRVPVYLPQNQIVKTELVSLGQELRLDRVKMRAGLTGTLPDESSRLLRVQTQALEMDMESPTVFSLGEGWGGAERWAEGQTVRWAVGSNSIVYLSAFANDLDIEFRAVPFQIPQRLSLSVNGAKVTDVDLDEGWKEYSIKIPRRFMHEGENLLGLAHSRSISPSEISASEDHRALAAAYDWIRQLPH